MVTFDLPYSTTVRFSAPCLKINSFDYNKNFVNVCGTSQGLVLKMPSLKQDIIQDKRGNIIMRFIFGVDLRKIRAEVAVFITSKKVNFKSY